MDFDPDGILAGDEAQRAMTVEATQLPQAIPAASSVTIGGLKIAVVDRDAAARDMIVRSRQRRSIGPLYYTSANGEVIARTLSLIHI